MGRVLSTLRKSSRNKKRNLEVERDSQTLKLEEMKIIPILVKPEITFQRRDSKPNITSSKMVFATADQKNAPKDNQNAFWKYKNVSAEQKLDNIGITFSKSRNNRDYLLVENNNSLSKYDSEDVEIFYDSKTRNGEDDTDKERIYNIDDVEVEDTINLVTNAYEDNCLEYENKMKELDKYKRFITMQDPRRLVSYSSKNWKNTCLVSPKYYGSNIMWRKDVKGFVIRQKKLLESRNPAEREKMDGLFSHLAYFSPKLSHGGKIALAAKDEEFPLSLLNIITTEHSEMISARVIINTTILRGIAAKVHDNPKCKTTLDNAENTIRILRCIFQSRWAVHALQNGYGDSYNCVSANVILKKPTPFAECSLEEAKHAGLC